MSLIPIVNLPNLYVNGLGIAYSTTTALTVALGQARDSTNVNDIVLGAGVTINAAVNGVNGLDIGTLANTSWYAVYVISASSNYYPVATLISLSGTAPYLPFGYDSFRRIGWVRTDGSAHFLKFFQTARTIWYDALITAVNALGTVAYVSADLSTSVPSTSQVVMLNWSLVPNTAANSALFRPTGSTSTTNITVTAPVAAKASAGQLSANTSALQALDYRTTEASDALTLKVTGYVDSL